VTTPERTPTALPDLPAVVELSGSIAPDLVEYVQHRISRTRRGDRRGQTPVAPDPDDATPPDVDPGASVPRTSG
jgi:hypothetical protein